MTIPFSFWGALLLLHIKPTKDFVVTGDGTAPEWNQTAWVVLPRRTGVSGPEQTKIKVLYSDSGIYCLYLCADKKITATLTTDYADLYNEDVVEAFFRPDDNVPLYF